MGCCESVIDPESLRCLLPTGVEPNSSRLQKLHRKLRRGRLWLADWIHKRNIQRDLAPLRNTEGNIASLDSIVLILRNEATTPLTLAANEVSLSCDVIWALYRWAIYGDETVERFAAIWLFALASRLFRFEGEDAFYVKPPYHSGTREPGADPCSRTRATKFASLLSSRPTFAFAALCLNRLYPKHFIIDYDWECKEKGVVTYSLFHALFDFDGEICDARSTQARVQMLNWLLRSASPVIPRILLHSALTYFVNASTISRAVFMVLWGVLLKQVVPDDEPIEGIQLDISCPFDISWLNVDDLTRTIRSLVAHQNYNPLQATDSLLDLRLDSKVTCSTFVRIRCLFDCDSTSHIHELLVQIETTERRWLAYRANLHPSLKAAVPILLPPLRLLVSVYV